MLYIFCKFRFEIYIYIYVGIGVGVGRIGPANGNVKEQAYDTNDLYKHDSCLENLRMCY